MPRDPAASDPRFPGWTREGEFLYRRRQYFKGYGVDAWPKPFSPEADSGDQLVFYDTETTGISGGAGSVIFLFGAAWCEGSDLAVEQLFLTDFPGEPEFLLAVQDVLGRYRAFVSYNGKTFDSNLLKTRFLMNRIPWEPGPQVDLLHHARRLWKSITGDCSLKSIERTVLGFTRELDIDGADIPLIWLEFLRTGRPGTLPVVFDHNVMDIASLARIYRIIGRLLQGDLSFARIDERSFGSWLLRRGHSSGAEVLRQSFGRGNDEAGIALGLHHKRLREWDRAAQVWEEILARSRSLFAAVELAKHHEHRSRSPDEALRTVDLLLSWGLPLDARTRQEIAKRRERLRRKQERTGTRAGKAGRRAKT
jgi:uncharacterized protein YprB with RNaseH-like and TPR domain